MGKKKRYIKGKVYIINDSLLVKHTKGGRRVVAMNNDRENMAVRRISKLYRKDGTKKERLIPIEKYPDITEPSGVEDKTFRKTLRGKPIKEKLLKKTKTRLNKWDMERIKKGKTKK